jgi:hypothetical protein
LNLLAKCIETVGEEIKNQEAKGITTGIDGLIQNGKLQGLELAKDIIKDLYEQYY